MGLFPDLMKFSDFQCQKIVRIKDQQTCGSFILSSSFSRLYKNIGNLKRLNGVPVGSMVNFNVNVANYSIFPFNILSFSSRIQALLKPVPKLKKEDMKRAVCRNPDQDELGPWCFKNGTSTEEIGYCDIGQSACYSYSLTCKKSILGTV